MHTGRIKSLSVVPDNQVEAVGKARKLDVDPTGPRMPRDVRERLLDRPEACRGDLRNDNESVRDGSEVTVDGRHRRESLNIPP